MSVVFYLAITNVVFNIGALIGVSLWASTNDVYTLSNSYEFYWFVTIFSNIIGLVGYLYHLTPYIKKHIKSETQKYVGYVMLAISVLNFVFWLSAASSVTVVLRSCIDSKQIFKKFRFFTLLDDSTQELTCNGQIISVVFGFLEFLLWTAILIAMIQKIMLKYNEIYCNDSNGNVEIELGEEIPSLNLEPEYVLEPTVLEPIPEENEDEQTPTPPPSPIPPEVVVEQVTVEEQVPVTEEQVSVTEEQVPVTEEQVPVTEEQVTVEESVAVVEEQAVVEEPVNRTKRFSLFGKIM
jgi:hypothetical protein